MPDFSLPIYNNPRTWIKDGREKRNYSWDEILLARKRDEASLQDFLDVHHEDDYWPSMTVDEWKELVNSIRVIEENTITLDIENGAATIHNDEEDNDMYASQSEDSHWMTYRKVLLEERGFSIDTINVIEKTTSHILKRLNINTPIDNPVKGLVIGNVQSGKTANMAALMSMAADWGWNFFIVFSGTIEILRRQTELRLMDDLIKPGLAWHCLEKIYYPGPEAKKSYRQMFQQGARQRYFAVCLKNATMLRHLIRWIQADTNVQGQMKILVIDDEADQAGINFRNPDQDPATINQLIRDLVNDCDCRDHSQNTSRYSTMNYVGYTATPYANVLNEDGPETLYPKNFISTLAVSKEYFGPQQIFGCEDTIYDGLDIIRNISQDEVNDIKDIQNGNVDDIPDTLRDAICWFVCGVAFMRNKGYCKPISMLVHTSQRTHHHECVSNAIEQWIRNTPINDILSFCRQVWERETQRFSLDVFLEQYPDYTNEVEDYVDFEEITPHIQRLLGDQRITNILIDDDQNLTYHQGIHMCIDNSKNNGVFDGEIRRLMYPREPQNVAPAFIVVGGATLSRGLTIEGLISTYFLRTTKTADTLMQMGRWFGYRRGYELLPRLWMTERTKIQFEFLAFLDEKLRKEIQSMDATTDPLRFRPKVVNNPKVIRVTAANRSTNAREYVDFSGTTAQTFVFDDNAQIMEDNLNFTREFILNLGDADQSDERNPHAKNSYVWRNIIFDSIKNYLMQFHFCSRQKAFNDLDYMFKWIETIMSQGNLGDWNVILCGVSDNKNDNDWVLNEEISINKIVRTKKRSSSPGTINIGVLRGSNDILADISFDGISEDLKDRIKKSSGKNTLGLRNEAGLSQTPQLIIYIVDKDSKARQGSTSRIDLNAPEDIVGLCINIPENSDGQAKLAYLGIPEPEPEDIQDVDETDD